MSTPPDRDWVAAWLEYANSDLEVARSLLEDESFPARHAALHIQQAAEKSIKAALISEGIDPPRTHDLTKLLAILPPSWRGSVLAKMVNSNALSAWATGSRYPGLVAPLSRDSIYPVLEGVDALIRKVEEKFAKNLSDSDPSPNL